MRIVVALGGNALQRRGEPMTVEGQRHNVAVACKSLAPVAEEHELVVSHGNGPQVGMLALQAAAYDEVSAYPFDVLGAQTEGMIGYLIEQELGNLLPAEKPLATILTMTMVDRRRPGVRRPDQVRRPGVPGRGRRGDRRPARLGLPPGRRQVAAGRPLAGPAADRRDPAGRVAAGPRVRGHLRRRRRDPDDVPVGHPHPRRRRGGHRQGPRQRRPRPGPVRRPAGHRHRRRRGLPRLGHAAAARGRDRAPRRPRPGAVPGRLDGAEGGGRGPVRPRLGPARGHRLPRPAVQHPRRRSAGPGSRCRPRGWRPDERLDRSGAAPRPDRVATRPTSPCRGRCRRGSRRRTCAPSTRWCSTPAPTSRAG